MTTVKLLYVNKTYFKILLVQKVFLFTFEAVWKKLYALEHNFFPLYKSFISKSFVPIWFLIEALILKIFEKMPLLKQKTEIYAKVNKSTVNSQYWQKLPMIPIFKFFIWNKNSTFDGFDRYHSCLSTSIILIGQNWLNRKNPIEHIVHPPSKIQWYEDKVNYEKRLKFKKSIIVCNRNFLSKNRRNFIPLTEKSGNVHLRSPWEHSCPLMNQF